jgi:hypothetical protein
VITSCGETGGRGATTFAASMLLIMVKYIQGLVHGLGGLC